LSSQSAIKHTVLDSHKVTLATQEDLIKHRDAPVLDATADETEEADL
jgi:hypothetical protein